VVLAPLDGITYSLLANLKVNFDCSDALSGLFTCSSSVPYGTVINTQHPGSGMVSVSVEDNVGNAATVVSNYTISPTLNFDGFQQPVAPAPTLNVINVGQRLSLSWQLPDGAGGFVTTTSSFQSFNASPMTCPSGPQNTVAGPTIGSSGLTFDSASKTFTYHWATTSVKRGCYDAMVLMRDGIARHVYVKVR
jgi:hypothetical protein